MNSKVVKILIVEASDKADSGLRMALKNEGFDVITAYNGNEAMSMMETENPDMVVLDPTMECLRGGKFRQTGKSGVQMSDAPIIVLNSNMENRQRPTSTQKEESNITPDQYDNTEIVERIKALHQLAVIPKERVYLAGALEMDLGRSSVIVEGKSIELTAKEFGLLKLFLDSKGKVLTRDVLREVVWQRGQVEGLETRTVDVHIGRLRRKLGVAGKYILTVRGLGYRFGVLVEQVSREQADEIPFSGKKSPHKTS